MSVNRYKKYIFLYRDLYLTTNINIQIVTRTQKMKIVTRIDRKDTKMKILLIEDNMTIIKGLKYALEKNNYEFEYRSKVKDAKKYLEENTKVDLIILDVA